MRALVGIKRVVDYSAQKIKVKDNAVDLSNSRMYINPFCEIAMQEAANLKAKGVIKEIIALCIGPKGEKKILWSPLAVGADRAIYVNTDLRHDTALLPLLVAQALRYFVLRDKIDLVLLGKQSVDDDCNQTGQLLAGLLDWPQATFCSAVNPTTSPSHIEIVREVDNGLQSLRLPFPLVLTCDLRLNTPKIASLPNMMKAKKAVIEEIDFATLALAPAQVQVISVTESAKKKGGVMVKDVDQLMRKLSSEAKVI